MTSLPPNFSADQVHKNDFIGDFGALWKLILFKISAEHLIGDKRPEVEEIDTRCSEKLKKVTIPKRFRINFKT